MRHAVIGVLLLCWAGSATAGQTTLAGRRLDDALRLLQQRGLPIVFSSELVTPEMRVVTEPRARTPRQQLDELLEPHGLRAKNGPAGVILVVRRPSARPRRPPPAPEWANAPKRNDGAPDQASAVSPYKESVIVRASRGDRIDAGITETTIDAAALRTSSTVLEGGGLEATHAMPRVSALDDFRSDFTVRGSPARHIGIVIDGVATTWLRHAVYGRDDAGSLSMFGSAIVDRATLQAGAYPRRYGDALGAELDLTLKEGSRERTRFIATAGGTSASAAGEGPIGTGGRGSWIAGARNSYRTWPPRRLTADDVGFAFADAHAKVVFDVSSSERLTVTALAGRSASDTADEPLIEPTGTAIDRAALLTLGWRSALGSKTVARQRVYLVEQDLDNTIDDGRLAGRAGNRALGYRAEVLRALFGGLLESGVEAVKMSGARESAGAGSVVLHDERRWMTRAAFLNFARPASRGLSFEGGARFSDSTLVRDRALASWIAGAWRFNPGWALTASAGTSRQFPELDVVLPLSQAVGLEPERAAHLDAGIDRRWGGVQWQAVVFSRVENNLLRPLVPQTLFTPSAIESAAGGARNSLRGDARGIELLVAPQSAARLSGWMSYAWSAARRTDAGTHETFWSELDRRHAVNVVGNVRLGRESSAGAVVRAASGAPLPVAATRTGESPDDARLPPYVRLDARGQRTFRISRHRLTVFGEMLNVLNRRGDGAEEILQPLIGNAAGASRRLMPRKIAAGIEVDLSR